MTDVPVMFTKEWLDSHTPEELAEAVAAKVATVKDSSSWQIRVEALRAAAQVTPTMPRANPADRAKAVKYAAKVFERYLEGGE